LSKLRAQRLGALLCSKTKSTTAKIAPGECAASGNTAGGALERLVSERRTVSCQSRAKHLLVFCRGAAHRSLRRAAATSPRGYPVKTSHCQNDPQSKRPHSQNVPSQNVPLLKQNVPVG